MKKITLPPQDLDFIAQLYMSLGVVSEKWARCKCMDCQADSAFIEALRIDIETALGQQLTDKELDDLIEKHTK